MTSNISKTFVFILFAFFVLFTSCEMIEGGAGGEEQIADLQAQITELNSENDELRSKIEKAKKFPNIPRLTSTPAREYFIAEVAITKEATPPTGWAFCDGKIMAPGDDPTLFSLIGTAYGGDGRSTFYYPNYKELEKDLDGERFVIATSGVYPPRQ